MTHLQGNIIDKRGNMTHDYKKALSRMNLASPHPVKMEYRSFLVTENEYAAIRNALMLADKVTQKVEHEFVRKAFGSQLHGLMCNVLAGEFETMIQKAQEEIQ